MTSSELLDALLTSFGNLLAPVLLVIIVCMVAIAALRVIWKSRLERLIEMKREDGIAAQEERDSAWLERSEGLELLERDFESKSNLDAVQAADPVQATDAGEDIDPFAEFGRLLAEEMGNVAPLDRHSR